MRVFVFQTFRVRHLLKLNFMQMGHATVMWPVSYEYLFMQMVRATVIMNIYLCCYLSEHNYGMYIAHLEFISCKTQTCFRLWYIQYNHIWFWGYPRIYQPVFKYIARVERPACWHRFCTVTGHFQAALEDSSVWTVIRLTTDLVTCPWSFAYGRINTVVNNNNNNINRRCTDNIAR